MGTPVFASDILRELVQASKHNVVSVFTGQDSVSKRGNKLVATPVKVEAKGNQIVVFTPRTLKDEEVVEAIKEQNPDVICVAAYGKILPKSVLEIPKFGCLNVHASLLPRWRGAAPIERAILSGDKKQGVSIMKMEEGLDTGDFCNQVEIDAVGKPSGELTKELALTGAKALIDVLDELEKSGNVAWQKQDESKVTYADKIEKNELFLNPDDDEIINLRRVLASADSHPSRCIVADKTVRIVLAEVASDESVEKGRVIFKNKKLLLGCDAGSLRILKLKPDGKKEMDATSFVAGNSQIRENLSTWSAP